MDSCGCNDFSRSRLLRKAAAEAGKGLPAIEQGMPLPAGTGMSRRGFVLRTAGLALTLYGLDNFRPDAIDHGIAKAAAAAPSQPVFVSIFLEGGADGLSFLYPADNSFYKSQRPKLALPPDPSRVFAEDTSLYWHPALSPIQQLHGQGKVTVLPAIGYTHPDQSHFTSRHYWEVGDTDASLSTGWLGRYLDVVGTPDNPLQGLSLDGQLSPTLATAQMPVAAIDAPASYGLDIDTVQDVVESNMITAVHDLGARVTGQDPWRAAAGKVTLQAHRLHEQLDAFSDVTPPVPYPAGTFSSQLQSLAALLGAGLPLQCVSLSAAGGYDTHSGQPQTLTDDLTETGAAIAAFQADLEARGLADRVLIHLWSEFGRRIEENASQGTDHGAAGVSFLIGTQVKGQMIEGRPALDPNDPTSIDDDGNLVETVDFRAVYCGIIEQWFQQDANAIIPNGAGFTRPQLIK